MSTESKVMLHEHTIHTVMSRFDPHHVLYKLQKHHITRFVGIVTSFYWQRYCVGSLFPSPHHLHTIYHHLSNSLFLKHTTNNTDSLVHNSALCDNYTEQSNSLLLYFLSLHEFVFRAFKQKG